MTVLHITFFTTGLPLALAITVWGHRGKANARAGGAGRVGVLRSIRWRTDLAGSAGVLAVALAHSSRLGEVRS